MRGADRNQFNLCLSPPQRQGEELRAFSLCCRSIGRPRAHASIRACKLVYLRCALSCPSAAAVTTASPCPHSLDERPNLPSQLRHSSEDSGGTQCVQAQMQQHLNQKAFVHVSYPLPAEGYSLPSIALLPAPDLPGLVCSFSPLL